MLRHILHRGGIQAWQSRPILHQSSLPLLRRYSAQDISQEGDPKATAPDSISQTAAQSEDKISALLAEKDEKIAELNDRTLRVLAEMENVRTIARRDVDNAKKYGIMGFAKDLLSVADNLGLALKSVPEDKAAAADCDPHLSGLFVGVQATENELMKVFAQHGLSKYGAVGESFDPTIHQAMYEAPVENVDTGIILDVTKSGYTIGERVLRPAEVGVSKGGPSS